jgi:transcriptional regulator with XRE-family HTH domain
MQFGKAIRVMRAAREKSQVELSAETGIALTTIIRAEAGRVNLKREQVDRVRMALCWPKEIDTMLDKLAGIRYEQ